MFRIEAVVCAAALGVFALSGGAGAKTLRFAHVYEASHPHNAIALWAAEEIKKRTGGRYAVDVFPASTLGKESDINEALSLGSVDMIYTGCSFAATSHGPVAVAVAPFVFRDFDHWMKFSTSDVLADLMKGYADKTGNMPLALIYYGERHVTSNKPIKTPADMKSLKIRVPDAPLMTMFPKAVGANPTPIAFAEVFLALQQGVVDAQENPLPTIKAKKFHEVQKYITLTGHMADAQLIIVSQSLWKGLSEPDRQVFRDVYRAAAMTGSQNIRKEELELIDWFRAQKVTVNAVDRAPFAEAVEKIVNGPDATWPKSFHDRIKAIR